MMEIKEEEKPECFAHFFADEYDELCTGRGCELIKLCKAADLAARKIVKGGENNG